MRIALSDRNSDSCDTDGKIAAKNDFTPRFDNTAFTQYPIFIPYNELHLKQGDHRLLFKIGVDRKDGSGWRSLALTGFYQLPVRWNLAETGEITKCDVNPQYVHQDTRNILYTANRSTHGMKGKEGRWIVEFYYDLGELAYLYQNGRKGHGPMQYVQEFTPGFDDATYTGGKQWDSYTQMKRAIKKAYNVDIVVSESPEEGPTDPQEATIRWE